MCWFCGAPVKDAEPLGRSLRCPCCGKDLRSCRNCRHYLTGSRFDCAESQADPVRDKEIANFCDWFALAPKFREATRGEIKEMDSAKAARNAFDNLFK
jgi:hypothetical protein